jgi:acetyl-CoA C-acetyltransferase
VSLLKIFYIIKDPKPMPDKDRTPVIVSATRTPVGRFLGGLSLLKAPQLGAIAVREAVSRSGVSPDSVDEVVFGNVVQGGVGQGPARQAAIHGGVSPTVPAVTINMVCGSGLKTVMLAAQAIKAGDAKCVVAGGMESMSNAPHYVLGARGGFKYGNQTLVDGLQFDGLWCSFGDNVMGSYAEYTAEKAGVSREQQDEYAFNSHMKAVKAIESCQFEAEIVPVEIQGRKGTTVVAKDEGPRADTSIEALGKLRPAFQKVGTVTAGNAPGLNDCASALVVTSQAFAEANGLDVLAYISAYATGGGEPKDLFFAPIVAVQNLMQQSGTKIDSYELIEANEAFAVQALADGNALGWDWDRVNVNGGAIALGHPLGASGSRILTTLLYAMADRGAATGLATICLGGGSAVAMSVERH